MLCLSHGIVEKYANTLNSNSKVFEALHGKLKKSLTEDEIASECSAEEGEAEAQAAEEGEAAATAAEEGEAAATAAAEKGEAEEGEPEAHAAEEDNGQSDASDEEPVERREATENDPFAGRRAALNSESKSTGNDPHVLRKEARKSEEAMKAEEEAKKEASKTETPGNKLGVDDGAVTFVSAPWQEKISDDEEAREEEAKEKKNVTEDLIKVAEKQAGAAQLAFPLASFTPWTPENIKLATVRMMDAINSKQGVHREDVLEMCSSNSFTYRSIWAENQGKHCLPWSPSLSNSVAVLAAHEDPPQADPHSPLACPRVLLSSKVVMHMSDSPVRSTRAR
jgi:hypothetical protein